MSSFDNFQCKDRQSESTGNNDSLSRQVFDQAHNFKWTGGSDQTNASSFLPPLSLDFGTGDQIQKQSGKTDVAGAADTTATADPAAQWATPPAVQQMLLVAPQAIAERLSWPW